MFPKVWNLYLWVMLLYLSIMIINKNINKKDDPYQDVQSKTCAAMLREQTGKLAWYLALSKHLTYIS